MDYRPSSLVLQDGDPKREYFSPNIRDYEKDAYDYRTVFFDAVRLDDEGVIRLFAPPMLNFLENLGHPEFYVGSTQCRSNRHIMTLKRFEEWRIHLPDRRQRVERLNVVFPKGRTFHIAVNSPKVLPNGSRILTAIQKDNQFHWIRDWYRYYRDAFEVDHLVLYDNGSTYQDSLSELIGDESVTVVHWDFPYGPSISHDNKFTQIGALNHCRQVFGRDSWIFSFDIDELLADPYDLVCRNLHQYSVHYFSSYFVPSIEDLPEDYSFSNFTMRRKMPLHTGKKYIYLANRSTGVLPHYVHSHRFRILDDLTVLLKKAINRTRWKNEQIDTPLVRLFNVLLWFLVLGKRQRTYRSDQAYFLHFKAITTNWKGRGNRFTPDKKELLTKDRMLSRLHYDDD